MGARCATSTSTKRRVWRRTSWMKSGAFQPTASQLAHMLHVAPSYVAVARKLSPATRLAIVDGTDTSSFMAMLRKTNGHGNSVINDLKLLDLVRTVGVTRVLDAACLVEAAEKNHPGPHPGRRRRECRRLLF